MKVSLQFCLDSRKPLIGRLGRLWQRGHSLVMPTAKLPAASRAGSDMTTEDFMFVSDEPRRTDSFSFLRL